MEVLRRAPDLLLSTTSSDVKNLIEMKKIGNRMSGVEEKFPVREHLVENVFDYYHAELGLEKEQGRRNGIVHNRQFVEGFPDVKIALDAFLNSRKKKFSEKVREAYEAILEKEKMGVGIAADFIAVMLYLVFSFANGKEIIN